MKARKPLMMSESSASKVAEGFGRRTAARSVRFRRSGCFVGADVKSDFVLAGGDDLAFEIPGELSFEDWVGELLEQDGREVEIAAQGDAVALKVGEDMRSSGRVGFCGGFVQPLHAVRPRAVVDHVGQMGMQGKGEVSRGVLWEVS